MEREVIDAFQKALKYCDLETSGSRQPVYQYRAASIQRQLALIYRRAYKDCEADMDNARKKTNLQLCKLYYDKAAKLLLSLELTSEFLALQIERIALAENQASSMLFSSRKL